MPGCYSPIAADLNQDGRPDIVTVSGFNEVMDPQAVWLMSWINQGREIGVGAYRAGTDPTDHGGGAGALTETVPAVVTGRDRHYPSYTHKSRVTPGGVSNPEVRFHRPDEPNEHVADAGDLLSAALSLGTMDAAAREAGRIAHGSSRQVDLEPMAGGDAVMGGEESVAGARLGPPPARR